MLVRREPESLRNSQNHKNVTVAGVIIQYSSRNAGTAHVVKYQIEGEEKITKTYLQD
jgi:hypothetical protein